MPITKGSQALVAEADARITTDSVTEIQARLAAGDVRLQLVDALTTKALQDMGMTNVAHIDGGFTDWVHQGAPVATLEQRKAKKAG